MVTSHDEDDDIINADNFKASLREGIELNPTAPIKRIYSAIAADEQRQRKNRFSSPVHISQIINVS